MKSLLVFSTVFVCMFMMVGSAFSIPTVNLDLNSNHIQVGDTFQIDVSVDGLISPDEVLTFGFDLNYSINAFNFNGATLGAAFPIDDSSLFGKDVAGSAFPGVTGDGIHLATLNFTSLLSGDFVIGIFSDPFNTVTEGLVTRFPENTIAFNDSIQVSSAAAPVPEPGTIVLLGAGLVGLVAYRKKRIQGTKGTFSICLKVFS